MRYDRRSIPRMFHGDRRHNWVLPVIAALLALFLMWRDVKAEKVWGVSDNGLTAFVVAINLPCEPACPSPLVVEFTMELKERR